MSREWHAVESKEALSTLKTNQKGLSMEEAKRRLIEFGPNELRKMKGIQWWEILLSQFKNILVIILLIAAGLAVWMGEIVDALVIISIVTAVAVMGFSQEYRGEKSLEALKRLAAPQAQVIRDGQDMEISSKELVPGDIVVQVMKIQVL